MKKVIVLFAVFTILFSLVGHKKEDPIADTIDDCAVSFAKAYLVNNFEYNPYTTYYISERLKEPKENLTQFPRYYYVYQKENILFCIVLYSSIKNNAGTMTFPYMGQFIYSELIDEATTEALKKYNYYTGKNNINEEIKLTNIKNVNVYKNEHSQEIASMIEQLLVEMSHKKIRKTKYTKDDKFYIKNPIKDYTIVIEDDKNISINEKLIYPLFMNDKVIALYEFYPNGNVAYSLNVGKDNIYNEAYSKSDKFIFVHGGNYPYLKTYCLFGDEQLDNETINEMLNDPIFIRVKEKLDQILNSIQPYEMLIEIEINET
ncbi:MAG: hypothetical protein GX914_02335 [Erysipelotrichia bacterium]|nr:hypothetical protein [Erysipelotrichia bacterium]